MFGPQNKIDMIRRFHFEALLPENVRKIEKIFSNATEEEKKEAIIELFKNQSFLALSKDSFAPAMDCIKAITAYTDNEDTQNFLQETFYKSPIFSRLILEERLDRIETAAKDILELRANSNADIYDIAKERAESVMLMEGDTKLTVLSNIRECLLPEERQRFNDFLEEQDILFITKEYPAPIMRVAFAKAVQPGTEKESIHPFIYSARNNPRHVWEPYQVKIRYFVRNDDTESILHVKQAFNDAKDTAPFNAETRQAITDGIVHCDQVLAGLPQVYKVK